MPFKNESFNLITSNNGLNNVSSLKKALSESYRVAKKSSTLIFTANLPGTMSIFYNTFRKLAAETGLYELNSVIDKHNENKRKSPGEMKKLLAEPGFTPVASELFSFSMTFANGSAFLNHFLIRLYFLPSWLSLIPADKKTFTVNLLDERLNQIAFTNSGLSLEIPFCVYQATREY